MSSLWSGREAFTIGTAFQIQNIGDQCLPPPLNKTLTMASDNESYTKGKDQLMYTFEVFLLFANINPAHMSFFYTLSVLARCMAGYVR